MSEEIPDEHNCIFHNRARAMNVYQVRDSITLKFFRYGLCWNCEGRLKRESSFKKSISDKLEEMLNEYIKKQEGKNGPQR